MNPAVSDVILGIVANGLTSIIAYIGRKAVQPTKPTTQDLPTIATAAAESLAENIEWSGPRRVEEIGLFLTSPEVEAIVRQILSAKLLDSKGERHLEYIRKEFVASFALYTRLDDSTIANSANLLYDALIEESEKALNAQIQQGSLSAHDIKSGLRHRIILDELGVIQKNLTLLTRSDKPDIATILEFERRYRQQVGVRHSYMVPPNFDTARRFHITDIYVSCNFTVSLKREHVAPPLDTDEFLSGVHRAVILGNPGGGKSTFASKLCYDLAVQQGRLLARRIVTPILVVLRDYGADKKIHNYSIVQFIEATSNAKYQVQPPGGGFEYLLLSGRAAVIFDGLDELLDTTYRQEISSDVEAFCSAYPSVPVIVTSREVGYEQAPLDEKRFDRYRLAPFDTDQVGEYASKWFRFDSDLTSEQQQQKTQAFLEESAIVHDLRSNPLMLALMCNIYRGENYIPRNRPEIYEKCATMLFERWDKSRGIDTNLPFEAHIGPAMKFLAYWIYSDGKLQAGVTENGLTEKATEWFYHRRFEDPDEAARAAHQFIGFCRGRAWVFTDTGTTREGERLYQFTHRTFLEYFTAAHLVRIYVTPETLGPALWPRIAKREWDVVAQLAFQLLNKNVEGAADRLLNDLLERAKKAKDDASWNYRSFAARSLEFVIPSPKLTRMIASSCIDNCLAWGSKSHKKGKSKVVPRFERDPAQNLIRELLTGGTENQPLVADVIEKSLVNRGNSEVNREALVALEIGLNLTLPLSFHYAGRVSRRLWDHWQGVSNRIFDGCRTRISELFSTDSGLTLDAFWRGVVSAEDLVRWHGLDVLFRFHPYRVFVRSGRSPVATVLVFNLLSEFQGDTEDSRGLLSRTLSEIGGVLLKASPPWVRRARGEFDFLARPFFRHEKESPAAEASRGRPQLEPTACFGAFAAMAIFVESLYRSDRTEISDWIKGYSAPFFELLRWVFVSRFEDVSEKLIKEEITRCSFTDEQESFVRRWIRSEFNLVRGRIDAKAKKRTS